MKEFQRSLLTASDTSNTVDGSFESPDGADWKLYGFSTKDGYYIPTGRVPTNRFRISDLIQINEAYRCHDRTNDHHFKTYLLFCDDDRFGFEIKKN